MLRIGDKLNDELKVPREYRGKIIDLLVETIKRYKQLKGKHQKNEFYLADLLK